MNSPIGIVRPNPELRFMARQQLKDKWLYAIAACFIFGLILLLPCFVPFLGIVLGFLIEGPMFLGLCAFFLKLARGQNPSIDTVFEGFKNFVPAFLLLIIKDIFIFLWSFPFIIPGIIAALGYSQSFFIMHDNPGIGVMDAIKRSKEMMLGYRVKLFFLFLSFIGWAILCTLTFGIGYIWLVPYIQTSLANFYENLKRCKESDFESAPDGEEHHCDCCDCCHHEDDAAHKPEADAPDTENTVLAEDIKDTSSSTAPDTETDTAADTPLDTVQYADAADTYDSDSGTND